MKRLKRKSKIIILLSFVTVVLCCTLTLDRNQKVSYTNAEINISNKKIEWGIKRKDNHEQPDLGLTNKELISKYNGIALGNSEKKMYLFNI